MKLLLDENLPHDLRHFLPGHEVVTVAYLGWKGIENGELLARAADERFDAVLTQDSGIPHEHRPDTLPVAVLLIVAKSNKLEALRPLVPAILLALDGLMPRTLIRVGP